MKNIKKIIVLLIIIILVILFLLIRVILSERKNIEQEILAQGEMHQIDGERKIFKIKNSQEYFQIKGCIDKYIGYVNDKNIDAIKSVLLDDYVEQKFIDETTHAENINDYIDSKYTINEIYSITSTYENPYYISGVLINNKEIKDIFFILFLDLHNNTYSLKDISEQEYVNMINGKIAFKEKNIDNKVFNINDKTYFSQEDVAKKYFYDYIENVVYYPQYAYKTLNNEYSKKRFHNYEEYKDYLRRNISTYKLMEMNRAKKSSDFESYEEYSKYFSEKYYAGLRKYEINKIEDYTQYICIDGNQNFYIFNVYEDLNYDVILDTYTIDLPKFTEKYNSSNIQQKVAMNIDKFIKSLNEKDYKYAYSCLADEFKNNKFKEIDIFEKFMKENIFEKNNIEFKNFKNEGETYIFNIILKNADKESEIKNMQVIMKLNEGTDFVMSFNIN